jgi:heme-degrading monooxygenase HmoA
MINEFVYIWSFQVKPGGETAFEQAYGPAGDWVQLFRKAPGYIKTALLRDTEKPGRYVTIDHWESEAAQRSFREKFAAEFAEIDRKCEELTESETLVGHFAVAG